MLHRVGIDEKVVHRCPSRTLPRFRDKPFEKGLTSGPAPHTSAARRAGHRRRIAHRGPVIVLCLFCHCRSDDDGESLLELDSAGGTVAYLRVSADNHLASRTSILSAQVPYQ